MDLAIVSLVCRMVRIGTGTRIQFKRTGVLYSQIRKCMNIRALMCGLLMRYSISLSDLPAGLVIDLLAAH